MRSGPKASPILHGSLLFDRKTDRTVIMTYLFAVLMSFALLFPFMQIP